MGVIYTSLIYLYNSDDQIFHSFPNRDFLGVRYLCYFTSLTFFLNTQIQLVRNYFLFKHYTGISFHFLETINQITKENICFFQELTNAESR